MMSGAPVLASLAVAPAAALFPGLLGEAFATLPASVRAVHSGAGGEWRGSAVVRRSRHPLAALACRWMSMPREGDYREVRVSIEAQGDSERWTRRFGTQPAMVSQLHARSGFLMERIGPALARIRVAVHEGAMHWSLEGARVLGCPAPPRSMAMSARVSDDQGSYHFEIRVRMALLGELIHYEGHLDVTDS